MKSSFKTCNILIILSCALRALLTPLYSYISYLYSYIDITAPGVSVVLCKILSDFLVSLAVFAMLAGIYSHVRSKMNKKAIACALVFLFSSLASSVIAYFAELLLVRAGLSDLTEAMFAGYTSSLVSYALLSFGAVLFLLFFTFVFAFALKPACDRATVLFALLSYTAGRLISEALNLYSNIIESGAPETVSEVIVLALPFIEQGVFAVAGYYIIKVIIAGRYHPPA